MIRMNKAYMTRRLRRLMSALFISAALCTTALLAACGGGSGDGGSPPAPPPVQQPAPPNTISLDRYLLQLGTGRWHGILTGIDGSFSTEFFSEPGRVRWGDNVEHWRTRNCKGVEYAWLDAYENIPAKSVYPVEAVIDIVDGVDVSSCTDGAAFAPLHIAGPVVTQQWFKLWDATHTNWRPGYWRGEIRPLPVANPCQAGRSLPAIELREVWWDSAGGWVRGHPKVAGALPWTGSSPNPVSWTAGAPVPIDVVSDSVETFALDSGLWTITEGGGTICLNNLTTW